MANCPSGGVVLAGSHSASSALHAVLAETEAAFPSALLDAGLPENHEVFRRTYPEVLPRYEAARLASTRRADIARYLAGALRKVVVWRGSAGDLPLHDALEVTASALPLQMHAFAGAPGWRPSVVYRGKKWESQRLASLASLLVERCVATPAAGEALTWVSEELLCDGAVTLSGRKIAVLGAAAEMAPTRLWLEAGADVLWLDAQPPPRSWRDSPGMSGRLFWPAGSVDLLAQPREVLATLRAFASDRPLDVGLYAYAPGHARELRLTAAMNALVDALPPELVGSVTLLVSPTTPTAMSFEDRRAMQMRLEARPGWEAMGARLGAMGKGHGVVVSGDAAASRTVVGIQGASYQAAQYIGKVMAAESWAGMAVEGCPRVSANTAAITRTRSLAHPVFAAAFGGAAALGVETLEPRQSRSINGLLTLHDWLHPEPPVPGNVRVHGRIHTLPYPLESALRVAATIGFARSPWLLAGLIRR